MESVGESNLKQQRLSPTYVRVRRNLPQIAQMNTDSGIYKICEYLCNLWENQISSSRRNLPQIAQMSTDTGIYKICEYLESVGESNLKQNDIKKRRRFKILKK